MNILSPSIRLIRDGLRQFKARPGLQYLLIVAFVLRFGYLMLMLGQIGSDQLLNLAPDTANYVHIGQYLAGYGPADETALIIFGPGYGAFLGLVFFIFGLKPVMVLLIQIILSSFSCLMIYRLGRELTGMKSVGYMAGYLFAVSFTSLSLSNFILSDSLFMFLFIAANLLFIIGLQKFRLGWFIVSGLCLGAAILTRSMAQFWPIILLIMIFVLPRKQTLVNVSISRRRLFGKAWLAPAIALVMTGMWIGRNYAQHQLPALSIAGSHGLGRLTVATLEKDPAREPSQIWVGLVEAYKKEIGREDLTLTDIYNLNIQSARQVFQQNPKAMISTYLSLIWENLNAVNDLYRIQLPQYKDDITKFADRYRKLGFNYIAFILSAAGLVCLAVMRRWQALVFLGTLYIYVLVMIGFGRWQGSRLFYPGQIASTILIGYFLASIGKIIRRQKA